MAGRVAQNTSNRKRNVIDELLRGKARSITQERKPAVQTPATTARTVAGRTAGAASAKSNNTFNNPDGLLEKGNINLYNRKVVKNPDGTISTVRSFSTNIDGNEVLLPSVVNGRIVSEKEAIDHYIKTGEHLGKFDTPDNATKYAKQLHDQQESYYGKKDSLLTVSATKPVSTVKEQPWNSKRDVLIRDARAIQQTGYRDPITSRKGFISDYNTLQKSGLYGGNDLKLKSKTQLENDKILTGVRLKTAQNLEEKYKNRTEEEKQAQREDLLAADRYQGALGKLAESGLPVMKNRGENQFYYAAQTADERNAPDEVWKARPEDYWDGNNKSDYDTIMYDSIYGDGAYDRIVFGDDTTDEDIDALENELNDLWDSLENGKIQNKYEQAIGDFTAKMNQDRGDYGSASYKRMMDRLDAETKNREEIEQYEANAPEGDWAYDPDAIKTNDVRNARIGRHAGKAASRTYQTTVVNGDRLDQIYYKANNPVIDRDISMSGKYYNLDAAQFMSPKQVEIFNAYFLSGDRESAKAYYDALEPYLQSMKMYSKDVYETEMSQNEYAPWMIGKRILTNPAAGIMGTAGAVAAAFGNEDAQDPDNELFYGMTRSNQNIQGARAQVWGKQFQDWFGDTELANNVGQWFNGIVYSMADNLVARGIGMGVGGALGMGETSKLAGNLIQFVMSSEATASQMYTSMKDGMDPSEAVIRAFGSGAIEWITEKYSTDRFFENFGNGNIAKQVVANFFPEAQEEGTGKIMETLLDEILSPIYGHESEFRKKVQEYDKEYGEGNGFGKALLEYCGELGSEMLAGGVSGGVMGGVGGVHANILNHNADVKLGKTAVQSGTVDVKSAEDTRENMATEATNEFKLLEAAEKLDPGSEARRIAKEIREGFSKGSKINYAKFGQMVRAIMNESNEQIGNIVQTELGDVLKKQLINAGEKEADAIELSQVLMQGIVNQALSPEMLLAIHDNKNAMALWHEYRVRDEAQAVQEKIKPLQEAQKSVMELMIEPKESGITPESVFGMMAGAQAATAEDIAEANANGKRTGSALEVIADGMYGEITGFAAKNVKGEDGKNHTVVTVQIGEGDAAREVDISAVKGLSDGAAQVLQVIGADRGQVIKNETAKALFNLAQSTKDTAGTVADAMKTMWAAAMQQKAPKTNLDKTAQDAITEAIQKDMDAAEEQRVQNWRKITPGQGRAVYNGFTYGTKQFNDAISKLGSTARNEANVIGNYAKSMGVEVELYYDAEDSARQGAFYGGQDGAGIRINLAGTINQQGAHRSAVATFAHEVTHNIEANSPTAYKALRTFVLQNMQKNGKNLQAELQHIMDNYEAHGESIDLNGAIAELVAMGSEQVLTSEEVATQLKQQDPSLFGKVRKAVTRLINQIRGIKGDVLTTSSRYARAMQNVGDRMAKIWLAAYEEAKNAEAPAKTGAGRQEYAYRDIDISPETIRNNQVDISTMDAIRTDSSKLFTMGPGLFKNIKQFYSGVNKILPSNVFGSIEVSSGKLSESFGHGMTPLKAATYAVLPEVLKDGKVASYVEKFEDDNYDSAVLAAPVEITDGPLEGEYYVGAVVKLFKDGSNKYYTHDGVVAVKNMRDGTTTVFDPDSNSSVTKKQEYTGSNKGGNHRTIESILNEIPKRNSKSGRGQASFNDENAIRDENGQQLAYISDSGSVSKYSLRSWDEDNEVTIYKKLVAAGFAPVQVRKWIHDVNSVAAIIAEDKGRLDYKPDRSHRFKKPNADVYRYTLDASTLCAKRLLYQGTFNEIQKQLKNTPLKPGDLIELANMMHEMGFQTPCGICYVESRRRHTGNAAQQWLEKYEGEYKPNYAELTTTDGLAKLKEEHPQAYKDFIKAMNRRGSGSVKLVQWRTDYRKDLRRMSKEMVDYLNSVGGIRVQSFSDFETPHLIDMMQAVLDMTMKGLKSQGYTKVPNFAWVFGDTGIKINLSLMGEGTGLDKNGRLVFSNTEGMDFDEAMKLRDRYSKNVGTILVGMNDAHIVAAMGDDRIDFIIPFHKSGWSQEEFDKMTTLRGYDDFEKFQNEKHIVGINEDGSYEVVSLDKGENNIMPEKYWNFDVNGQANAERYLEICKERGLQPKFWNFLVDNGDGSYSLPQGNDQRSRNIREGYWKTLIDFKMYDNNGVGAPQQTVRPNINMQEAERVLREYEGGANTLPKAEPVIDRYVKWYKEQHPGRAEYSMQDDETGAQLQDDLRAAYDRYTDLRLQESKLKGDLDDFNKRIKNATEDETQALIDEIAAWQERTGYDKLAADLREAEQAWKKAQKALDEYTEQRDEAEEQEKIRKSGLTEAEWRRKEAIKQYGYTGDFREAGYLLPNGRMLNFCGSKGQHYGMRGNDHRDIGQIYANKQGSEAMVAFMAGGNIRIMAESPGIDISTAVEPTAAQYTAIRNMAYRFADEEYFNLDLTDKNGNNVGNIEYEGQINPSRIVNDIRHYFRTGEVREQSTTSMFHGGQWSMQDDTDYDVKAWMETVPEWSLRTEAEKTLLRSYGSLRRKGQMDQLRMEKIDAEIKRLEGMQGKSATSEGTPVTTVTVDEALKANGIVQDGAMLKQNGVIIGSLQTGVLNIYDKYKDIRKKLQNSGAFEYDEKTDSWNAKAQNIYADQERDVQKRLEELRIRKQNLQKTMDETNEQLAKITGNEGFGNMMYRQHKVVEDLAYNKTQAEVRESIEKMEKSAKRVQGIIDENRKKADELESSDVVKRFRELLGTTTADQTAAELKKEFSSTWTKKQIREFLDPIILKMKSGEDFQQDVETLAGILVNSDSRNTYEELEALRGLTITLGKGAQAELKAQNSSLKEIRARLAGTGITVKYGDRSTLEADIENLRAEYPMIPELGDEKDALENFVSWVEGMKNQSAGNEFYDQRLAEAMAMITGKAAGAAKGIYMPNDPKAQRQVLTMMDFVKGLNAETQQALEALQQVADEMGAMQKAGREASGKTDVLMRDVNVALDYYNRISKISVDEAKQKRTSALIEQLKSETAQKIIKNNEEWRQLIQRDADARKQLDENRKAAAQINTSLRRMYNLLKGPKGTKNIPEYMQGLAREVLGIFARNDAEGGRRFLNSTRDGLKELQRLLEAWEKQDGPFNPADLSAAEEAVTINLLQDLDIIREGITAINTPVNGKNKLDTLQQRGITLGNIRDAVSEIYSAIRAEQEVQIGNRRVAVEDAAYKIAAATNGMSYREWTGKMGGAISWMHKAFVSGNMTPVYFFRTIGNEGLNDLWDAYHWAENRNGLELAKAQARLDEIAKAHGFDQWDMGQTIKLPLEGGETEVTLGQLMSLWATWKREKTLGPAMSEHLTKGGFFAEKDLRDGILGRTTIERRAHRVTEEDMENVKNMLTDEQRKFVDDVVLFMSRDMSELGNAASMAAYGIRMYKEKYYFPFQMWDGVKSRKSNDAGSAAAAQDRAFHPSFSWSRKHGADNAIVIGDFMQTATDHIAGMINYATMGLANETMQKVLNQQTAQGPYETKRNTRAILEEAYGKEVMQYLADLQLQLKGGAVRTSRSLGDKAISIFRKNAVAGSLSVALQQPLSYIRAAMLINPKYLTKAALSEYWKNSYKERMAYSGVSVIKEMGRFDMALGQSAREYLMPDGMESRGRKIWEGVKEYSTILPELMDRWTWNRMWVAVKAEQHALLPEMDVKSEEFLTTVGERFNELMRRTQVYDSVLVKSQNMRSDNYFVKSLTSFMAEPTLTINVLADAVRSAVQGEKGGKTLLAKAGATFILSAVLQAVFKGLMSTGRTPDEKKNWEENFLYRFFANFMNEIDPLQLVPGYSDAVTLLKDGKLQDDAMGALGKLFTAGQKGVDLLLGNGKNGVYRDLEDSVGQLTQLFSGLPLKNLMRDARAMWNWAIDQPYANRPTDWNSVKYQTLDTFMNADNLWGVLMDKLGESGYDTSNTGYYQRIYNAKKAGNEDAAQDMISYLLNGKGVKQETINSKMISMAKADTGATAAETAQFIMNEGKDPTDYIRDQLKGGKMSADEARKMLMKADPKKNADDAWWQVDRIQYQIETKGEKAPSGKGYRLKAAISANNAAQIQKAVKDMMAHGITKESIKKDYLSDWKSEYLAADSNRRRQIRDAMQKAYKAIGYTAEDADKTIKNWEKSNKKKK